MVDLYCHLEGVFLRVIAVILYVTVTDEKRANPKLERHRALVRGPRLKKGKGESHWAPAFGFVSWLWIQHDWQPLTLGSKPFGPRQTVPSNCEPKQTLLSFNCFITPSQRQEKQCCTCRISDVNISVKNADWNLPGYALCDPGDPHIESVLQQSKACLLCFALFLRTEGVVLPNALKWYQWLLRDCRSYIL